MLLKLSLKEIKNRPFFVLLFVLNVSLGITGITIVESFRGTVQKKLHSQGQVLLGADLRLTSRFPLPEKTKKKVVDLLAPFGIERKVSLIKMFSMGISSKRSRLIFINSTVQGFPFYGKIHLENDQSAPPLALGPYDVWVYPEVLRQLDITVNDNIIIGNASYKIKNLVVEGPEQINPMESLTPRIFMSPEGIKRAEIVGKGSTVRYHTYYKLKHSLNFREAQKLTQKLQDTINDHGIRITSLFKASQNTGLAMNYLSDFLGLVSLVALFLSFIGIFYLYKSYLSQKTPDMSILLSLGLSKNKIIRLYLLHTCLLSLLGTSLGLVLGFIFGKFLSWIIPLIFSFEIPFGLTFKSVITGFSSGLLGVFLLSFPLIVSFIRNSKFDLFQNSLEFQKRTFSAKGFYFIPLAIFCFLLSIYLSHSIKIGGLFVGFFIAVLVVLLAFGLPALILLDKSAHRFPLGIKISLRYLTRFKLSTLSLFICLVFCCALSSLILFLETGPRRQLAGPQGKEIPDFFLFDIQEDYKAELTNFLKQRKLFFEDISPMVRGKIETINGQIFKAETKTGMTREEQRERRFRNRGTNLSFRTKLSDSERIISGRPFSFSKFDPQKQDIPEISLEHRFAKRMGTKVGDRIEFNILGTKVLGVVVNLRSVRWTSFRPNFFILFQEGVLENLPKTYLGVLSGIQPKLKEKILQDLGTHFPGVSVFDVRRVIDKLLGFFSQLSYLFKGAALLVLLAGAAVVYSLTRHQALIRSKDLILTKILGMDHKTLQRIFYLEFFSLAAVASLVGTLIALGLSFVFSYLLFESLWEIGLKALILPPLLIISLSSIINIFSLKNILNASPVKLFDV